ncbi:MAG: TonB-dependent receptor [Polyangiaceae bacterium]|nr:TonB-dependent receptor [Polyangiaceae bacterium]
MRPLPARLAGRRCAPALLGAALLFLLALPARMARAGDLADEADLAFTLGTDAYRQGDLQGALQHFLRSNRLVRNRNVLYNIARTYEKLSQFPEAYRYYWQALDGETDPGARARIQAELEQIATRIAVLDIETKPSGATLYLDRKDLGPRGKSPRRLGVAPGTYKIIAALPGYETAELALPALQASQGVTVVLELRQILGQLEVAAPRGGSVRIDDAAAAPHEIPCQLELSPGRHRLIVQRAGFEAKAVTVDVVANQRETIATTLQPLTGSLVVETDEPGATVRVDGRTLGFTPAVMTLPVGSHEVSVELRGFQGVSRRAVVAEGRETKLVFELTQVDEIVAASRATERVEQAPSSVSIVSRREILSFAYPTLAEALRGQPGVYAWDDRSYVTLGLRGLGRLGSYGNRILVLSNGLPTNDNWIGSSYVGYDALTDLGDVERIEVVRGPGSVLYGTNAFSGVINVVTREAAPGVSTGVSTDLDGVARARVRADAPLGRSGHIWSSFGAARGEGRDQYFAEYAAELLGGVVRDRDGFDADTVHGAARYEWLAAQWSLHSHSKHIPTGGYDTDISDPRMQQRDTRAFLELRAEPEISSVVSLMTRAHLNLYRFVGLYPRVRNEGGLEVDAYHGQWLGLEQRVRVAPSAGLRFTLGAEAQLHYRVWQTAQDDSGVFLDDKHPYRVGALYALADADLSKAARVSAGARYDAYSSFGGSLNPRAALIVNPYPRGTLKLMGGNAFRAPSVYELYYNDGGLTQVASPDLRPESITSAEVEHSHRFSPTVVGTAAVYANHVRSLITPAGSGNASDPLHYENSDNPLFVVGSEIGLRRDFRQGTMLGASYSFAYARLLAGSSVSDLASFDSDPAKRHVANAPMHLASLRGAVPLLARAVLASTRLSFEGPRYDRNENVTDPRQRSTRPFVIWDIVLSGEEPRFGLLYAVGVYNAFDWRYSLPTTPELAQNTLVQDGRTFLASVEKSF